MVKSLINNGSSPEEFSAIREKSGERSLAARAAVGKNSDVCYCKRAEKSKTSAAPAFSKVPKKSRGVGERSSFMRVGLGRELWLRAAAAADSRMETLPNTKSVGSADYREFSPVPD